MYWGMICSLFYIYIWIVCYVNIEPSVQEEVEDPHLDVFKGFEASGHDVIDEIGLAESEKEKKKKKRKRKGAKDLRFEMEALAGTSTKRKERKKK